VTDSKRVDVISMIVAATREIGEDRDVTWDQVASLAVDFGRKVKTGPITRADVDALRTIPLEDVLQVVARPTRTGSYRDHGAGPIG
jgi:hypothetical protein